MSFSSIMNYAKVLAEIFPFVFIISVIYIGYKIVNKDRERRKIMKRLNLR